MAVRALCLLVFIKGNGFSQRNEYLQGSGGGRGPSQQLGKHTACSIQKTSGCGSRDQAIWVGPDRTISLSGSRKVGRSMVGGEEDEGQ